MMILALIGALIAGFMVAIQPGINGQLAARMESPLRASTISFTVGCLTITTIALLAGHGLPRPAQIAQTPVWMLLGGGMVGSFFVTMALAVAPRIGATYWVALVVAGQMSSSVVMDHFGWLGFAKNPVTPQRLLAIVLIVAGVVLIARR